MRTVPPRLVDRARPARRILVPTDPCFSTSHVLAQVQSSSGASGWPTANLALAMPFAISVPTVVEQFGVATGTTLNVNVDIGIYTSGLALLTSTGSVALSSASTWQWFNVTDIALPHGRYYLGMSVNSTSAQDVFFYGATVASALATVGCLQAASSFALPNPLASTAEASSFTRLPYVAMIGRAPY